jgi:hypothetical protein
MTHGRFVDDMPRRDRRIALEMEARRRKTGNWPAWERVEFPAGTIGPIGWTAAIRGGFRNEVFMVYVRPLDRPPGVTHLAVSSLSGIRPTWPEMMRIKNELCGEAFTGIEVYPPAAEVVDEAPMYHLWVNEKPLPFGLFNRGGK